MKASVHITTSKLEIIAYTKAGDKISVKEYLTYPIPEECVINGVILDGTPIIEGLKSLKSSNSQYFKEVSLVIDGSFVYSKKITVPGKLNKLKYDEVIRDEFAEVATDAEHLICDFYPLSQNADGSKDILSFAVENAHAQAYLSIFSEAEIKLSSVHLGVQAILRFVNNRPDLKEQPFILNLVDGVMLLSMIFQNGVNVFQSRSRLYGEDRLTIVNNTLDGLSGNIQFNRSQNFTDITHCYYLGLSSSDMDLVNMNTSYPDIKFAELDIYKGAKGADILPPGSHLAFLNTLVPDSQADLLSNIKMLEKAQNRKKPKNIWIPVLACTVLVLAAVIAGLWLLVAGIEREIRDINGYLMDPVTVNERTEVESLMADTARINGLYNAVNTQKSETAAKPQISSRILNTIIRTSGTAVSVTGFNFSSEDRALNVSNSSETEVASARFVEALSSNDQFDTVYYTGYRTGTSGEFVFNIDVIATGWREEVSTDETGS